MDYLSLIISSVTNGLTFVLTTRGVAAHLRQRRHIRTRYHVMSPIEKKIEEPFDDGFYCLMLTDGTSRGGHIKREGSDTSRR